MNYNTSTYFAADKAEETVAYLDRKAQAWFDTLVRNEYINKIKKSWSSYHGVYYRDSHEINFGGEQGELINLAVNHYRNLAQHMLVMVTSTRPAFQARSTNIDHKSQCQTLLANGILEYYMREKRLEKYLKLAVEYAIVLGSGYIKMEWNSTTGEIHDVVEPEYEFKDEKVAAKNDDGDYIKDEDDNFIDEEGEKIYPYMDEEGNITSEDGRELNPYPIYDGDVMFANLSPFDVVFDSSKETSEHDWVICRTFKNKFDLAAKFPEYDEEIKGLLTKTEMNKYKLALSPLDDTVDVPVYEFFHKKSESLPNGRYVLYLSPEIILIDTPMPYRELPVYRIAPAEILGTPYGYTSMFDLLPLQDALNSLYSTALTNNNAFGVQNILNPRGNDVKVNQLEGALNFIEYNATHGKPEALQLTATSPETYQLMTLLERAMETISGVNAVARGNPEANLRSGNALALVQSQALQFISGLQGNYIQLIEDIGTGLIKLLQDFASAPRVAEISGKSNKSKMKSFTGDDLSSVNRVIVDVGNALSQTTAGRSDMAANLIQMGVIKTPEQYFSVINTGKLETMTEGINNELLLIRAENERLVEGDAPVLAIDTDNHPLHIAEHKNVLADPDARLDNELVTRTLVHIQEHIDALRNVDPDLLGLIGLQSLQPPPPQGGMPPGPPGAPLPPGGAEGAEGVPPILDNPESISPTGGVDNLPNPASPPTDPTTGESLLPTERPLGNQ